MQTMNALSAKARFLSYLPMIARVLVPGDTTAAGLVQAVARVMDSTMDIEWGTYVIIGDPGASPLAGPTPPFAPADQIHTRVLAMVVPQIGYERVWYQDTDVDETTGERIDVPEFFADCERIHRALADHFVVTVRFTY